MSTPEAEVSRAPRTWGPFTGRQLTVMLCTLIVAVVFPVGAFAVTGANSFITDASSGKRAKVDSAGNLYVRARTATPANTFNKRASHTAGTCSEFTAPAGKALVVTNVRLYSTSSSTQQIHIDTGEPGLCRNAHLVDLDTHTASGVTEFSYPSGLPIANGHVLYVWIDNANAGVSVNGYLTASADCSGHTNCK